MKGLFGIVKNKSPEDASRFGAKFGMFVYKTGLRRSIVRKNLEIAFGNSHSSEELKEICKNVYRNMGSTLFEFLKMKFIEPEKIGRYIEIEGLDILEDAIAEQKGVVMAGFHFGNWELMSAGTCSLGRPVYGYAGRQKNPLVDDEMNFIRRKFGMKTISKSKGASREMIKALKTKEALAIGSDLNVPSDSLFVEFFGKKAAVGKGQAAFIRKMQTPYLYFWAERVGPFRFKGHIKKFDYQLSGDADKDSENLIQMASSALEKIIKKTPDQYFWFNRRWKTRPKNEEDVY